MLNGHTTLNLAVIAAGAALTTLTPIAAGATVAAAGIALSLNPKIRKRDGAASAIITASAILLGLFMSAMAAAAPHRENGNPEDILIALPILTGLALFSNIWTLAFILRGMPIPGKPASPKRDKPNRETPKPPFT